MTSTQFVNPLQTIAPTNLQKPSWNCTFQKKQTKFLRITAKGATDLGIELNE